MKNRWIIACVALLGLASCAKGEFGASRYEYAMDGMSTSGVFGSGINGMGGGQGHFNQGEAGVLTAGEWNDLSHWGFWSGLMTSENFVGMSDYWRMFTSRRVFVRVADGAGNRLPAVPVVLEQGGKAVWTALTDNQGEASLWVDPFHAQAGLEGLSVVVDGTRIQEPPKVSGFNVQQEAEVNYYQLFTMKAPAAEKKADIAFIVDATGSMGDEIAFLKKDLMDILDRVKGGQADIELRTGTVFYRDEGDEYVTKYSSFTSDYKETIGHIAKQYAAGGGDLPEAVHTALEAGLQNLSWNTSARARIAFLVLDAPAHQDHQGVVESLQASIRNYAANGIKLIPVFCSSQSKECEFMCRFFAVLTGGTYVFLTDDSGVGDDHIEASVGEYQVEPLNDLLVRLIAKYIG